MSNSHSYYTLRKCSLGALHLIARSICNFRPRYESESLLADGHLDGFEPLSDGELATTRVVAGGVDAHGLSHLKLVEVGTGSLSELVELGLDLQSLELFLGRLHSLEEGCLLLGLLILLLLLTLRAIAVLV